MTTIYGIEDSIAMSEDGQWFAFNKSIPRGKVMGAMAAACMSWEDAIHAYKIHSGHIRRVPAPDGSQHDWHTECAATDEGAFPAWIVKGRGVS